MGRAILPENSFQRLTPKGMLPLHWLTIASSLSVCYIHHTECEMMGN
jgi:hypothetical protein